MLWLQREGLTRRQAVTLWLVASRFAADVSLRGGAELVRQVEAGPGVIGGSLDGFPTFLIDLQELPFSAETLSLHLVSRGRQERPLVEYVLDPHEEQPLAMQLIQRLHAEALMEVLQMRNVTPEQQGLNYQALLELIGKERAVELIGKEQALDFIGKEQALDLIGEEEVRRWLARRSQPPASDTPPAN
jgi:hypothetical protein